MRAIQTTYPGGTGKCCPKCTLLYEGDNCPTTSCQPSAGATCYIAMPKELTAENGAKALLIGEFSETININCPECANTEDVDDCEICGGTGSVKQKVTVSWPTIKAIYKKAVEHLAI